MKELESWRVAVWDCNRGTQRVAVWVCNRGTQRVVVFKFETAKHKIVTMQHRLGFGLYGGIKTIKIGLYGRERLWVIFFLLVF